MREVESICEGRDENPDYYDVFDEYPDYDYRGDERYHSPPDEPSRAGAIAWLIVGYMLIPIVAVFGGFVYWALCKLGAGKWME